MKGDWEEVRFEMRSERQIIAGLGKNVDFMLRTEGTAGVFSVAEGRDLTS